MKEDFYQDINELNSSLKNLVSSDLHDSITEAVNYSSTSTEMLLKLKFYFSKINLEVLDDKLLLRVEVMKNKIDDLLK